MTIIHGSLGDLGKEGFVTNGMRIGSREGLATCPFELNCSKSHRRSFDAFEKKKHIFLSAKRLDLLDLLAPFSRYLILNPQPSIAATPTVSR